MSRHNIYKLLDDNPNILTEYIFEKVSIDRILRWLQEKANLNVNDMIALVTTFLQRQPTYLDSFVIHFVPKETIMSWLAKREQEGPPTSSITQIQNQEKEEKETDDEATHTFSIEDLVILLDAKEYNTLLAKWALSIQKALDADYVSIVDSVNVENEEEMKVDDGQGRFLRTVVAAPNKNDIIGMIEFGKKTSNTPFRKIDFEVCAIYSTVLSLLIKYHHLICELKSEKFLKDYITPPSHTVFDDKDVAKCLIKKILLHAKRLVTAERSSLFLYDDKSNELIAEYFQMEDDVYPYTFTIRCSVDQGFAGFVYRTGLPLNIENCYADPRFNREVDVSTGYLTKNMLCYPVKVDNKVIGVIQTLNKLSSRSFTIADEKAMVSITAYCSVAVRLARLHTQIRIKQERLDSAMELLYYHITCDQKELREIMKEPTALIIPPEFDSLGFPYLDFGELDLAKLYIYIIYEIFGKDYIDLERLCSFVLTVKANYRPVIYHNFHHAFNVAHSMYILLNDPKNAFTRLEMKALVVACICHDIDHRGFNNSFMIKTKAPLAALYPTSTMERHHFQLTISILQEERNNVFFDLSNEDYKKALDIIHTAIMATDLAGFKFNKDRLEHLLEEGSFNLSNASSREALYPIMMTGCDLSASGKPWQTQLKSVHELYEEFYIQGDTEKEVGFEPLPMMNRKFRENIPKDQVGFISFLCLPCYKLVTRIVPNCQELVTEAEKNLEMWKTLVTKIADEKENKLEAREVSSTPKKKSK